MKLKIDENLPVDAAAVCRADGRALITLDTDFGNVRAYPPADHPGIIVLGCGSSRTLPAPPATPA